MTVCVSIGGPSSYEASAPVDELMVGTIDGVVALARKSGGWEERGRTLAGKHVHALLTDPKSGRIFAGIQDGGIYTSDDGRSWARRDNGVEYSNLYAMNSVQDGDTLRIYAGTEPAHLYVTTDLGESWEELPSIRSVPSVKDWTFPSDPHDAHVKNITFDPRSPDTIFCAIEVGGVLKSEDRGKTWIELNGFYEDVHRLGQSPGKPDSLYMTTGDGFYSSADGGGRWEHLTSGESRIGYPDGLVVHPRQPELVFMSGANNGPGDWRKTPDADSAIGRTRDGGRNWEYLAGGLPAHIHGNIAALCMNVWPGGFELFSATTDGEVFHSGDGGDSWSTIASGLPAVSKGRHYRALSGAARPR
ncbi:MAG: hypothetical protein HW416_1731 [Chloroflexi bacterium]|nr:hypothetical protein [Chloroflexota bacterium]